jgi:8-oxo-dGTP pyrophosphatase MutT (NUDIX family)/SAM-dependent methyltransferase
VITFTNDLCLVLRFADGSLGPPGGTLEPGEHWVNTALREAREEAGAILQSLHPFGAFRCRAIRPYRDHLPHPDFVRVVAWADATPAGKPTQPEGGETILEVLLLPPAEAAQSLRSAGAPEFAELVLIAEEMRRRPLPDSVWFEDNTRLLEKHYLAQADPAAQSGKSGGIESWNESRRVIARAIPRDGTFLDVGCANGLLMESVQRWGRDDHHLIEPYGVDLSPGLVELARRRLPHWADRIWAGNAWTWKPPRRFDFVHTRVEYVPERYRDAFVARQLDEFVAPGGRLLVTPPDYGPPDHLVRWGFQVGGEVVTERAGRPPARVAWIDKVE